MAAKYAIHVLTSINTMTNLLELEPIATQMSEECTHAFENGWLSHYPRPVKVIHEQGSEFMGVAFQTLLQNVGIHLVPSLARNSQGNSIMEAVHKSVDHMLQMLVHLHHPQFLQQAKNVGNMALTTAMHATCCASHQALQNLTPGSLAFCHSMFF